MVCPLAKEGHHVEIGKNVGSVCSGGVVFCPGVKVPELALVNLRLLSIVGALNNTQSKQNQIVLQGLFVIRGQLGEGPVPIQSGLVSEQRDAVGLL